MNSKLWEPGSDGPSIIHSFKSLVRMVYYSYSKFMLEHIYRIKIPLNEDFFEPDYCDLYNIFKLVRKIKPAVSLEVGSGYSTLIFAEALKKINKKKNMSRIHYCLEQDEAYLNKIKKYQNLEKSNYVKFIKTDLIIKKISNKKVSICKNFPNININLFYEDRTNHDEFPIAGDALFIEKRMPNDYTICIDGMIDTVNFYRKNLGRSYSISGRGFHGINFIPHKNSSSI